MQKNKKKDEIFSSKPLSGVSRSVDDEIKSSLTNIYRDKTGDAVDVTRLDSSIGRGFFFYFNRIIALIFAIVFLYIGVTFVKNTFFKQSSSEVSLSITGPTAVTSGDVMELTFEYVNPLDVPLTNVELRATFPDSFFFEESIPTSTDADGRVWRITGIAAGERNSIIVRGRLYWKIADTYTIESKLSYQPENFSSMFEKNASLVVQVAATRLISEKTLPAQASAGSEVRYEIKLFTAEKTEEPVSVKIVPQFPESFEMTTGTTPFIKGESAWELSGLTTTEDAPVNEDLIPKIVIVGRFTDDSEPEQKILLSYYVKGPDNALYLEKEDELITQLVKGDFIVSLILNGETATKAVTLGETLTYSLTYKNQSASDAKDVRVELLLPEGYFTYDTLIMNPVGKRSKDTLTWTKDEVEGLGVVASGDDGTIDITVTTKKFLDKGVDASSFITQARATIKSLNEVESNIEVKSNVITSPINSDLNWAVSARYYNDEDIPVGIGPMPPKVGKTTTLRIFWKLSSGAHTVSSIKIRGKLPTNVKWTGKKFASKGALNYDEATRTVSWDVDRLDKGGGELSADFEISITPTVEDVNKIMLLMAAPMLSALDQDTEGEIKLEGKAVTTDLDGDPVLSGRGLVEN